MAFCKAGTPSCLDALLAAAGNGKALCDFRNRQVCLRAKDYKEQNPVASARQQARASLPRDIYAAIDVQTESGKGRAPTVEIAPQITWDNNSHELCTVLTVSVQQRPSILQAMIAAFKSLGVKVNKLSIDFQGPEEEAIATTFLITNSGGQKIEDLKDMKNVEMVITNTLKQTAVLPVIRSSKFFTEQGSSTDESPELKQRMDVLYRLMDKYMKNDIFSIQKSILHHTEYTLARSRFKFDDFEAYQATAFSVRDRLLEKWNDTHMLLREKDPKRVYYVSMEFLMGRSLLNSIFNLGVKDQYAEALRQLGFNLEVLAEQERDAALGNGGLGRLAACFLDSLATLDYPAWGYGLRYEYGIFRQVIQDGFQHERPDYWLNFGNPWEIQRIHTTYPVKYYGKVEETMVNNRKEYKWIPDEVVEAVAYDNPIPGYGTNNTINLRLWAAKPSGEFDLQSFNTGDYVNSVLSKQRAEIISNVLYPDDRTYQGKELRLKQQYFLVSASLQDVVRRFKERHSTFDCFADKVAFHLNDTHPTIGVIELMRILVDEESLDWKKAWDITTKVYSFTIHTVIKENLEKWPVELLENVLPRHMKIIYRINYYFLEDLKRKFGNDYGRLARMSIIEEGEKKNVRMATLALVACHTLNGVSEIHSEIIKKTIYLDFAELWPDKFQNKTNGVTQRRWLAFCNPDLSEIITKRLGTEAWVKNLHLISGLRQHANDPVLQKEWIQVKRMNKLRLAKYIEIISKQKVSIDAMFDVQVKRIHEYKRQFLNILSIIHRYDCIKNMSDSEKKRVVPRVCILGGKAAPGYEFAKKIIKLVHVVGEKINNDPDVGHLLKLIFIPDYNVSVAELIVPASDLSQHISLAGTEASGTGNMKFAMNGSLILGTMDGTNVEICKEIGKENMFIFGARVNEVSQLRADRKKFQPPREFRRVVGMIRNGYFGHGDYFQSLCDSVDGAGGDQYLLANDFSSYLEAQAAADKTFVDKKRWTEMSILSTAGTGKFSSDRAVKEYAEQMWGVQPLK